jgi:hypothetical protein
MAWRRRQVIERGYEGYVATDEASVYAGGPTRRWLKVKQKGWTVEEDPAGGGGSARLYGLAVEDPPAVEWRPGGRHDPG